MNSTLPLIRVGVIAVCILSVPVFFLSAASASRLNIPGQDGPIKVSVVSEDVMLLARGGLSLGMTKKEAYDVKGVPDKINRMQGEVGKEMWVYKCQDDDGFDEDCLHLYFDGDSLVKIDRL